MSDAVVNGKVRGDLYSGNIIKNKLHQAQNNNEDNNHTEPRPRPDPLVECCCNDSWVDFTQNTTLHGLKYIWLPGALPVRRLLWLLLTVTCVVIMSYQIIERIVYYYDWPVTVNVKINFNKTLLFPTLTLCNQNAFRSSKAAELKYYHLLTSMYTGSRTFSTSDLDLYNASSLTFSDLFTSTTHTKEDLIVSCSWRGEECGPHNFTEVMTDHGVCYSFNLPDNNSTDDRLSVLSPGAENGLSLTLNVEQYEYMPGPHDAAGVKILVHDHKQFPKVQELGIALPTGTHTFLGMQLITVENLPKPHGECLSPDLQYFPEYSLENCEIECFTKYMVETCGCRLFYMPDNQETQDVCTLKHHYECYQRNSDIIRQTVLDKCHCPVPCKFHIFDPTVSYATTSIFVIDRFLSNTNRSALKLKYQKVRDITNRLQNNKFVLMKSLVDKLDQKFQTLTHLMMSDLNVQILEQEQILQNISQQVLWNWKWTNIYFQYQNYILQKNLVRARDAMDERTFSILAHGVQEFAFSIETKIKQLVDPEIKDSSVRDVLFLMTKNQLNARLDIAWRARQNYTQLITGFINATSIFNYKFLNFARKNSNLILPKELLSKAFTRDEYVRKRSLQIEKDIIRIARWMKEHGRIAKEAYYNNTLNVTDLHIANVQFLRACRIYLQSRSMFFNDFIQWPVDQLNAREAKFVLMRKDFIQLVDITSGYFTSVTQLINSTELSLVNTKRGIELCQEFLSYGNVSKLDIAEYFTSKEMQKDVNKLRLFFETVRSRSQNIYDSWDQLSLATRHIWNFTLSQTDLMRYWRYRNMTRYLRNYTEVAEEIAEEYSEYRDMIEVRCKFHNKDEEFLHSLESLMEHMKEFQDTSHVDSTFVRDNFLKLNVFYRELSYEKITQQEAYDIFALLCDIGGSIGLFIGASVMTIFEILDLIMYHTMTSSTFKALGL